MCSDVQGMGTMIALAQEGITFDSMIETQESFTFYISVPEKSYNVDPNGIEMAGKHLAKRFRDCMTEMGFKRLTVKSKTREGDIWTKEKSHETYIEMREKLLGSQY